MSIAFACPRCGKSYTADASLAGREGRCKACGRTMTVPSFPDDGDDTVATQGYDLTDPLPQGDRPGAGSTFVRANLEPDVPRSARRRRPPSAVKSRSRREEDDEPFLAKHGRLLIAAPVVLLAGLGLMALLVPNGTLYAAGVLAVIGGIMVLVGYFVGLWAAFQEDMIYGVGYLVFPPYTAYYFVTRWDDLWPFFAAMTLGAGLVAVAGTIAEARLGDSVPPAAARVEVGEGALLCRGTLGRVDG